MPSWRLLLAAVSVASCTFPTDGTLLQADPPDAENAPGDAVIPDAEVPDAEIPDAETPDAEVPDAEVPDACVGVEVCNDTDDDCDMMIDEDFDLDTDVDNCGSCGHACTNLHGTTQCMTTMCLPSCSNGAAQCDGNVDNGCELQDTNPTCPSTTTTPDLSVNGDAATTAMTTGTTERILRVRIAETVPNGGPDLTARIALVSGAGTDFDLVVYCPTCGTAGITDATDDIVEVGKDDVAGPSTFDVFVEVRYDGTTTPSTTCNAWTLTVTGGVATANRCGN